MGSEARAAARKGRKKSLDTGVPNSGGTKPKKVTGGTTGVADFFTPVSKRCKVAAEIAEHEKIEGNVLHEAPQEENDDDFQVTSVSAKTLDYGEGLGFLCERVCIRA